MSVMSKSDVQRAWPGRAETTPAEPAASEEAARRRSCGRSSARSFIVRYKGRAVAALVALTVARSRLLRCRSPCAA